MSQQSKHQIPYFAITEPYDVVYRKSSTSHLILPHTHNALEIYFTLTDLPDVLLNDTVSGVGNGALVIIPPYHVHQLFTSCQTVYERYIISINSEWLQHLFPSASDVMNYADIASQPAIIYLSAEEQTLLCDALGQYLKGAAPYFRVSAYCQRNYCIHKHPSDGVSYGANDSRSFLHE